MSIYWIASLNIGNTFKPAPLLMIYYIMNETRITSGFAHAVLLELSAESDEQFSEVVTTSPYLVNN